jgi:transcriptional regulator GlxA family with amidase domain
MTEGRPPTRRIGFLIFPGFQLLDAAGPIAAFEIAARLRPGSYELRILATRAGRIVSSSGATLEAQALPRPQSLDTVLVAGGEGTYAALECLPTRRFLRACAARARRVASVCSGSFLLAAAGLLDGLAATTHWSLTERFRRAFPNVRLDPDRIFVREGKVWTAAGISAGIDLALALIGEDLGEEVAQRTAQQLVVYHRRPGGQSQFSALLEMERAAGRFAGLLEHVRTHLEGPAGVEALAARCCMSPRNFARAFRAETGLTPAKAVERIRADAARALLQSGAASVQAVAARCGFGDPERMRRAFVRLFGASPAALRRARARRSARPAAQSLTGNASRPA